MLVTLYPDKDREIILALIENSYMGLLFAFQSQYFMEH
jgi:hypothetical protein